MAAASRAVEDVMVAVKSQDEDVPDGSERLNMAAASKAIEDIKVDVKSQDEEVPDGCERLNMAAASRAIEDIKVDVKSQDEDVPVGSERLNMAAATSAIEDVVYVDSQDEDDPDGNEIRPIMRVLRRFARSQKCSVVYNKDITDILNNEFNMCVRSLPEVEGNIYFKVIETYLRRWPQWIDVDRLTRKLKKIKDRKTLEKVLERKYKNLKEYLGVMLEACKPLVKESVKKTIESKRVKDETTEAVFNLTPETGKELGLEVHCTKEELNRLFFRRPRVDLNNTIFNIENDGPSPSLISVKSLTFKQIIKGWCMKMSINLPHFSLVRELSYNLKHRLVNKVHYKGLKAIELDTDLQALQRDQLNENAETFDTDMIVKQFLNILRACRRDKFYATLHALFNILILELHDSFDKDYLYKIPANYRWHANKYQYVRYMYTENDQNDDPRYDLQLEEIMAPTYNYFIEKFGQSKMIPPISEWLIFECMFCQGKIPLTGPCGVVALEAHFKNFHQNEPDWECTHCKKTFSIDYLSNNKLAHEC